MGDESEPTVIGALPHSRPQRRSDKRAPRPQQTPQETPQQTPQETQPGPAGEPAEPSAEQSAEDSPALPEGIELLGTVVRAAAELAGIGPTVGARALRGAISRLPRP